MSNNYEIFSNLQMSPQHAEIWGRNMLEAGEPWGSVWDAIKGKFPGFSAEELDRNLNKDFWYNAGAYEQYIQENPEAANISQQKMDYFYNLFPDQLGALGVDPASSVPVGAGLSVEEEAAYNEYVGEVDSFQSTYMGVPTNTFQAGETVPEGTTNVSQPSEEMQQFSKDLYNQVPGENDAAVQALFDLHMDRTPSLEELNMYRTVDPALAQTMIEAKAAKEAAAANSSPMWNDTNYLVKFSDDPTAGEDATDENTIWLFNTEDHNLDGANYTGSLIPFESEEAFNSFFDGKFTLEEATAMKKIRTRPTSDLSEINSPFYKARLIKSVNAINSKGEMTPDDAARWRYGQPIDEYKEEQAKNLLQTNFRDILKWDDGFTQEYYDNAFMDRDVLTKYLAAVAYGGYSIPDIYKDIIAHNKRIEGDPAYANYKGISQSRNVTNWKANSEDYTLSSRGVDAVELPDLSSNNFDWKVLQGPLWAMPDRAYQLAISDKDIDIDDPETKEKIDNVQTLLEDVAIQMANADNEREMAAAQFNWDKLKGDIEKDLNIQLSDNAYSAWNQVEALRTSMSERGIMNSGIQNKAIDFMGREVRRANDRFRESSADAEDSQLRNFLLNNGEVEDIQAFIDERGEEEAREWGLLPSEEALAYFSLENMKEMYPDKEDDYLQKIIDISLGVTESGLTVNRSVSDRNNQAEMRELEINKSAKQLEIYFGQQAEIDRLDKEQFESSLFGSTTYPTNVADNAAALKENEAVLNAFQPERILNSEDLQARFAAEKAAGRSPENSVARTSGVNIYKRDLAMERLLMPQYIEKYGITPSNENEFKAFRDFVYETPGLRPTTEMGDISAAASAAGTIAEGKPATQTSDFSTPNTAPNTGFTAATPSAPFKTWTQGKKDILGKNWEGYAAISASDYDSDEKRKSWQNVQNVSGTLYGYK